MFYLIGDKAPYDSSFIDVSLVMVPSPKHACLTRIVPIQLPAIMLPKFSVSIDI